MSLRALVLLGLFSCLVAVSASAQNRGLRRNRATEGQPCQHVLTDMVPDLKPNVPKDRLAHVEIRWCEPAGPPLQIVAWKERAASPSIVLGIYRDTVESYLVADNVFAMVFPGGYDTVVVIQYARGEPRVAFTDSTHAEIWLANTNKGVEVTLDYGKGKKTVKRFSVSGSELTPPQ